jgi:hypothetical protein
MEGTISITSHIIRKEECMKEREAKERERKLREDRKEPRKEGRRKLTYYFRIICT